MPGKLERWIDAGLKAGRSERELRRALRSVGWNRQNLDCAFGARTHASKLKVLPVAIVLVLVLSATLWLAYSETNLFGAFAGLRDVQAGSKISGAAVGINSNIASPYITFDKETYAHPPGTEFEVKVRVKNPLNESTVLTLAPGFDKRIQLKSAEKDGVVGRLAIADAHSLESHASYKLVPGNLKLPTGIRADRAKEVRDYVTSAFTSEFGPSEEKEFTFKFKMPDSPTSGELFFYALGDGIAEAVDPWWNSSWSYGQNITVTNNLASQLSNYQINISVNTTKLIANGQLQLNCADLRFTNSTSAELGYWVESGCNTGATKIWINVPNIPASGTETVVMHYGNIDVSSAANGTKTFLFFDDFSTADPAWMCGTGNQCNISGGVLRFGAGMTSLQATHNISGVTASKMFFRTDWAFNDDAGDAQAGEIYIAYNASSKIGVRPHKYDEKLYSYTYSGAVEPSVSIVWGSTSHKIEAWWPGGSANQWKVAVDDSSVIATQTNATATTSNVSVRVDDNPSSAAAIDNLTVANYVTPEPSISFASAEVGPGQTYLNVTTNPASAAANDTVVVHVKYTNATSGAVISTANCLLNTTLYNANGGTSLGQVNMSFMSALGNHTYNYTTNNLGIINVTVTCNSSTYVTSQAPYTLFVAGKWFNNTWPFRRAVVVQNNVASQQSNYQVNLRMDTASLISAGKMQANCNDLRFANSTGSEIAYWFENASSCNTTSTTIWAKVPNIPASGTEVIAMYYGNLSALLVNVSNINTTFTLGDDFEDNSFDSTRWTRTSSGSVVEQNKRIEATDNDAAYKILRSVNSFSGPMEFRALIQKNTAADSGWVKTTITDSAADFDTGNNGAQLYLDTGGTFISHIKVAGVNTQYSFSDTPFTTGTYYWLVIRRNVNGTITFNIESESHTLITTATTIETIATSTNLRFNPIEVAKFSGITTGFVDTAFARNYTSPEPTYLVGTEENVDSALPAVTNVKPVTNGNLPRLSKVDINATVTDGRQVDAVQANITLPNGTLFLPTLKLLSGSFYNVTFSITDLIGRYNATIVASDGVGNVNKTESTFFSVIDVIAPAIDFVTPTEANNTVLARNNILVNITTSDDVSVANLTIYLYNVTDKYNESTSTTSPFFRNFTGLSEGNYTFNATATDTSNNRNSTQTRFVIIDITRPSVTNISPVSNANIARLVVVRINASITDLIGVSSVRANVTLPNGTLTTKIMSFLSENTYNATFPITDLVGRYNVTIIANDTANNVNGTETTFFNVQDILRPNVTQALPSAGSNFTNSAKINISATVVDDVSVSAVVINITLPNGTIAAKTAQLFSGSIYNTTISETNLEGRYNVTMIANDTSNNINNTETTFFNVAAPAAAAVVAGEASRGVGGALPVPEEGHAAEPEKKKEEPKEEEVPKAELPALPTAQFFVRQGSFAFGVLFVVIALLIILSIIVRQTDLLLRKPKQITLQQAGPISTRLVRPRLTRLSAAPFGAVQIRPSRVRPSVVSADHSIAFVENSSVLPFELPEPASKSNLQRMVNNRMRLLENELEAVKTEKSKYHILPDPKPSPMRLLGLGPKPLEDKKHTKLKRDLVNTTRIVDRMFADAKASLNLSRKTGSSKPLLTKIEKNIRKLEHTLDKAGQKPKMRSGRKV